MQVIESQGLLGPGRINQHEGGDHPDLDPEASPEEAKLLDKLEKFVVYLDNNRHFIVNYGDRHRHGEPIASGFVESAVNQVVSKRFVKRGSRWPSLSTRYCWQTKRKRQYVHTAVRFDSNYLGGAPKARSAPYCLRLIGSTVIS